MSHLIWIHEDALSENHPVFRVSKEDVYPFFIWDNDYFRLMDYGYNRLNFIYQTLSELPVEVYKGSTIDVLLQLKKVYGASSLFMPASLNVRLQYFQTLISNHMDVNVIENDPFVKDDFDLKQKRFFYFWKRIRSKLLSNDDALSI